MKNRKRVAVARWLIRASVGVVVGAQTGTFLVWMLHSKSRAAAQDIQLFALYMILMIAIGVSAMLVVRWWAQGGEPDARV